MIIMIIALLLARLIDGPSSYIIINKNQNKKSYIPKPTYAPNLSKRAYYCLRLGSSIMRHKDK